MQSFTLRFLRVAILSSLTLLPAGLLTGCGGGSGAFSPGLNGVQATQQQQTGGTTAANPLTNPDIVIFASARSADQAWHYYAMNPDGSGLVQLTQLTANARLGEGIQLNQTGTYGVFAFDYATGGGTERTLYRLSDGKAFTDIITTFGRVNTVLAANSTGSKVAVGGAPTAGDPNALYVMNLDGTQKTALYTPPAGSTFNEVSYAPDDQTLYFVLQTPASGETPAAVTLYKLPAGASVPVVMANVGTGIQSVHTSRDGTKLAFISLVSAQDFSSATFAAYTLNADGTGLTKGVSTTQNNFVFPPDISIASRADGFHVLYVSRADGAQEIYDMRPDGTGLTQLTYNAAGNTLPGSRQTTLSGSRILSLGGR